MSNIELLEAKAKALDLLKEIGELEKQKQLLIQQYNNALADVEKLENL